jgi:hypothetical protein
MTISFQERRWWASCNAHHLWSKQMIRGVETPKVIKRFKREVIPSRACWVVAREGQ